MRVRKLSMMAEMVLESHVGYKADKIYKAVQDIMDDFEKAEDWVGSVRTHDGYSYRELDKLRSGLRLLLPLLAKPEDPG